MLSTVLSHAYLWPLLVAAVCLLGPSLALSFVITAGAFSRRAGRHADRVLARIVQAVKAWRRRH